MSAATTDPVRVELDPAPEPGEQAERFAGHTHVKEINRGGMGRVLRALDPATNRWVAIKVLHDGAGADELHTRKFVLEGQVTAQLEHPAIVPIHKLGVTEGGEPYFSMKLVHGQSLTQLIADGLPLARRLEILIKVCDAVSFAHSRGVIHRDLKPENIMVGAFGEVLVMDWGLARVAGSEAIVVPAPAALGVAAPDATLDGAVQGTPIYMSPEQADGDVAAIDERSDIYALGAVLYELLARVPPFDDGRVELQRLLAKVALGRFQPPSRRTREPVPRELEAVVLRAMALEQEDRYPSVRALQADLQRYLEGRALSAVDYGLVEIALKWARRHRGPVAAVAAVLLLAAGIVGWGEASSRQQRRARLAAELSRAENVAGDDQLEARWQAVAALDRALLLAPDDSRIRAKRRAAGAALGRAAVQLREWTLARLAVVGLEAHGSSRKEVAALAREVALARRAEVEAWKARVDVILAEIDRGLDRPDRSGDGQILDYLLETVRYRHPAIAQQLGQALRPLERAAERGRAPPWSQPQRDRATYVCRALGRLALAESIAPLARWTETVRDPELLVVAGLALCHSGRADAHAPLIRLRDRAGINSSVWRQVRRRFDRVPTPTRVSEQQPQTASQLVARGLIRADKGDLDGAIRDYTAAIAIEPSAGAYANRGNARRKQGDLAAAIRDYDKAIELDPSMAMAYSNRAAMRHDRGDFEGAIVDLNKAIEIDPDYGLAYTNRGNSRRALGDLQGALEDLDRAVALDPRAGSFASRALARQASGDVDGAIRDYDKAIEIDPGNSSFYSNRGVARHRQRDFPGALRDYAKAIEIDPRNVAAFVGRGDALRASGDLKAALASYDKAVAIDERSSVAHLNRGTARLVAGDRDSALRDFGRAIDLSPRNPTAYFNRGIVRMRGGDAKGALADLNAALTLDPKLAAGYMQRGLFWAKRGKHAEAIRDYDKAIALEPGNRIALFNRANARRVLGQRKQAVADYDRAIAIDARMWQAWVNRGVVLAQLGQRAEARRSIQRARQLAPAAQHAQLDALLKQLR